MYLSEDTLEIAKEMIAIYGDKNKIGDYKISKEKVELTPEEEELLKECFED